MKEHQWEWFFYRRRRRLLSRKLDEHLQWAIYSNAVPWCRRSEIQLSLIFVDFYISLPIPLHSHIRQCIEGFHYGRGFRYFLRRESQALAFWQFMSEIINHPFSLFLKLTWVCMCPCLCGVIFILPVASQEINCKKKMNNKKHKHKHRHWHWHSGKHWRFAWQR